MVHLARPPSTLPMSLLSVALHGQLAAWSGLLPRATEMPSTLAPRGFPEEAVAVVRWPVGYPACGMWWCSGSEGNGVKPVLKAATRGAVAAMAMTGLRQMTTSLGLVERTPPDSVLSQTAPQLFYRVPVDRRAAPRSWRRSTGRTEPWAAACSACCPEPYGGTR